MNRFSRWASSAQALYVLAAVFAVGAVIDIVLGHRIAALVSAVLAIRHRRACAGAAIALEAQLRSTPPGRAPVTAPSRTTACPATQTPEHAVGGLCFGSS